MKRILVIEDDKMVLENVVELLSLMNYQVYSAVDGLEGIEKAKKYLPDLILCDILMPYKNGYDVYLELSAEQSTNSIPFIFLSALGEVPDIRKGLEIGADDYLLKPFYPEQLFKAIETRLGKRESIIKKSEAKLNELRYNLTSTIPHEFRTPLNIIISSSQYLMEYFGTIEIEEVRMMHQSIYLSATRLHKMIINYLCYADIELMIHDEEQVKKLKESVVESPEIIVRNQFEVISTKFSRVRKIKYFLESSPIKINDEHFSKICEELADNAFKFSQPDTGVMVYTYLSNNDFYLKVQNYGVSLKPEQISRLDAFVQFDRKQYEQQGSGLGLAIVKKILEIYSGSISIDTPAEGETIVIVRIPVA